MKKWTKQQFLASAVQIYGPGIVLFDKEAGSPGNSIALLN